MKKFLPLLFLLSCASSPIAPSGPILSVNLTPSARALHDARGTRFLAATGGPHATLAAQKMFDRGGNIIDAVVAASFVISVERPHSTGIGGGGFLLFHEAKSGKTYAVDFRERAPLRATRDMYLDAKGEPVPRKSMDGIHAVAVPGLVAGLAELHQKFGKLPWADTLQPAIELAENGLDVYENLVKATTQKRDLLASFPTSRAIFLRPDGSPFAVGEKLFQKDLGRTLRLIAQKGRRAFYEGEITREILRESRERSGILQAKDFSGYQVKWREPIRGSYRDYELFSMPPPSSGGVHVVQMLNILERDELRSLGLLSADAIHLLASTMQRAFADRAEYLGDPDFVKVPTNELISKDYAARLRAQIGPNATPSAQIKAGLGPRDESPETTHLSLLDAEGNAVSSTQTINLYFGSGLVAGNTGIMLNDEMDDFSIKPGVANAFGAVGGSANAIAPKKTPLSSMTPTILLQGGRPVMAVGAPGGTNIITCTMQTIVNYLDYGLPIYEAITSPRVHHQWLPDRIDIDGPGPGASVVKELEKRGHTVNVFDNPGPCRVEAVVREGNIFSGAADPRDVGAVLGR